MQEPTAKRGLRASMQSEGGLSTNVTEAAVRTTIGECSSRAADGWIGCRHAAAVIATSSAGEEQANEVDKQHGPVMQPS